MSIFINVFIIIPVKIVYKNSTEIPLICHLDSDNIIWYLSYFQIRYVVLLLPPPINVLILFKTSLQCLSLNSCLLIPICICQPMSVNVCTSPCDFRCMIKSKGHPLAVTDCHMRLIATQPPPISRISIHKWNLYNKIW